MTNRSGKLGSGSTVALVLLLSGFWLLLSGRIGVQYFLFMAAAVGLVVALNPERPFSRGDPSRDTGILSRVRATGYLLRYIGWLVWNVVTANVEVARIILHPRLPIDPKLIVFRTTMRGRVARALVANSITLTPGTITVDLDEDEYLVHALAPGSASAVRSAALQNAVAAVFGEAPDPPPEIRSVGSYRELQA